MPPPRILSHAIGWRPHFYCAQVATVLQQMARLAQNWVETNFSATVAPINSLEKSFANGYNFLKILEEKRIISEEDLQEVSDGNTPKVVMKNMAILTKGLKSININLSKQQIADVCSFLSSILTMFADHLRTARWCC
jgi:hypothetical protein